MIYPTLRQFFFLMIIYIYFYILNGMKVYYS